MFEVDLHRTLAVLAFTAAPLAVHKVTTVAVYFADRRLQVVQVGFNFAVCGILVAVFTPAVAPALQLVAELPGWHHVFPFDSAGALGIFTRLKAAAVEVGDAFLAVPLNLAAAVEAAGGVLIDFDRCRFGLGEVVDAMRVNRARNENHCEQNFAKHIPKQLKIRKARRVAEVAGSGKSG
ncbi:protein of unknown function [Serratia sp. Tan611]|nr:protein of unknown function [Serratia sp. Tan611]